MRSTREPQHSVTTHTDVLVIHAVVLLLGLANLCINFLLFQLIQLGQCKERHNTCEVVVLDGGGGRMEVMLGWVHALRGCVHGDVFVQKEGYIYNTHTTPRHSTPTPHSTTSPYQAT